MSLVIRHFAVNQRGSGDGTTCDNAAPLFPLGAWSSIITGFSFAGTDALECRIQPGDYAFTSSNPLGVSATVANPVILHGSDANGNRLAVPAPAWTSDQAPWDAGGLPQIGWTNNITLSSSGNMVARCLAFSASGVTNRPAISSGFFEWCSLLFSSDDQAGYLTGKLRNCQINVSAETFEAAWAYGGNGDLENVLLYCTGGGVGGNRNGIESTGTTNVVWQQFVRCTVRGFPGIGIVDLSTTTASRLLRIRNCVLAANSAGGIKLASTTSGSLKEILGCCITGSSAGAGIDCQGEPALILDNRLRDNAGGDLINAGNWLDAANNYTTAATDADDYNDAEGGDYRIKATAGFANRGIGVSQMPSAGGNVIVIED